ncbi:MAG: DUF2135 domain-containing protein [Pseudomonadota bacterium]|nr:DUF2135 domain-containing protein [Pseudomonadota bacterium]
MSRRIAYLLTLCVLAFLTPPPLARARQHAVESPIRIDTPQGGWRQSNLSQGAQDYLQTVQYPASDVNTPEGQSRMATIAGQIRDLPKTSGAGASRRPYTLVVNGVAMPIKVHGDGHFSRPYSFGPGSNDLQMISPDGRQHESVQFYEANAGQLRTRIRVVLAWNTDNTDLDLHVITPDGQHAWYGHRDLDNGGALDVDVTDGYGPEIFSTPVALPGLYYVYVNYYGGYGADAQGKPTITVARVTVITDEGGSNEKRQTYVIPMRQPGELVQAARFVIPGKR